MKLYGHRAVITSDSGIKLYIDENAIENNYLIEIFDPEEWNSAKVTVPKELLQKALIELERRHYEE